MKRIREIDQILNASPLLDIIALRKEAQELVDKNDDYKLIATKLKQMAKREKELFALAKVQQDSMKLIDEKVKLTTELGNLHSEQWQVNMRKKHRKELLPNQS